MPVETAADIATKAYAEGEFNKSMNREHTLKQREGSPTTQSKAFEVIPLCIRFLANEMIALGESFLT